jgi:general secretion pathway protein K
MTHRHTQGYALILVLWVLVLLTTIAMAFSTNVRTDTRAAISLAEQVRLRAAADAAIAQAIHRLTGQQQEGKPVVSGLSYELPWPNATLHVTMVSESAKIDINYAPRPLLIGLFREVLPDASSAALADALLDWRDRDDRRSPQGAEASDYRQAGRRTLPANRPFQSATELGQVIGFDADRLARLLPYITVYARRPRIDPYSADPIVLAAVPGLDKATAQDFVAYRDAQQASGEPVRLERLSAGIRYLERRPFLSVVSIHTVARNASGRALARQAVVRVQGRGGRYKFLDWRQTVVQPTEDNT